MREISYSDLKAVEQNRGLVESQAAILMALQHKPIYQGTTTKKAKARRRAANKVARASRRKNR